MTTTPTSSVSRSKRRTYSPDYKREAVALAAAIGASKAASDLGIDHSLISSWKKAQAKEGGDAFRGHGVRTAESAELVRLRREVAHLQMEREILKKATEFFMREQM